jgi:branched-chain amino acid transport system substrate-binding protein
MALFSTEGVMITRRLFVLSSVASCLAGLIRAHAADTPGVTDTEIKIGQTMPYSGPGSAYASIGRAEAAYLGVINEQGGVNGRKIILISVDDGYSPPKTIEQTRRLVEEDGVAFIYGSFGGSTSLAVRQYLNENKIPQLGLATAADIVDDPDKYPWTMGLNPAIVTEARIYAKYILATKQNAKIAILFQSDALGQMFVKGLREGLGAEHSSSIVKEVSYELSDPSIDQQIISLQASGADLLILAATSKAAAQGIRKAYDMGWAPDRLLFSGAGSVAATLRPAGLDKSRGIMSAIYVKDFTDPRWKDDPGIKEWMAFGEKYLPSNDAKDHFAAYGFQTAKLLVQVLTQCGNDLSRENILRQALNVHDWRGPLSLPGTAFDTSPTNYFPLRQMQMARFNGETWEPFGDVLTD